MHRSFVTIVMVATSVVPASALTPDVSTPAEAPATAPSAAASTVVDWAAARYAAAGLVLPDDMVITFHDSSESCGGNKGRCTPSEGHRIRICQNNPDPALELLHRRHVVVHEMAHMWIDVNVSEATAAAFMNLRGADNWNDREQDWFDRGTEQAAEIVAIGLLDERPAFVNLRDASCASLTGGFELLTGTSPIDPDVQC